MTGRKLLTVVDKGRPIANRLDQWFHGRLSTLSKGPMVKVPGSR